MLLLIKSIYLLSVEHKDISKAYLHIKVPLGLDRRQNKAHILCNLLLFLAYESLYRK